ncbi:MAG: hypothetical protein IKN67_06955, partial [Alphaproteobacteria bacterium]|nr:hypothetical protein [Alphaproteobacteria bacterium]
SLICGFELIMLTDLLWLQIVAAVAAPILLFVAMLYSPCQAELYFGTELVTWTVCNIALIVFIDVAVYPLVWTPIVIGITIETIVLCLIGIGLIGISAECRYDPYL